MIFDALHKNKLPYAVVIGTTRLLSTEDVSIKDYCIVGSQKDWERLRKIGFTEPPIYLSHKAILEYELSNGEVREFKERIHKGQFTKVLHNEHGRVYEREEMGLKEYITE